MIMARGALCTAVGQSDDDDVGHTMHSATKLGRCATHAPPLCPMRSHTGDLHGDYQKTRRAFQLAGLTDGNDRWVGGSTVCVQVRLLPCF